MSSRKIRVLVIDDSAFARKVIREVLTKDPEIDVIGIARDGLEGLEKIAELKPDVVTLDLIMPDLDGIGVLKAMPKEDAPKVIIVSVSGSETELALEALELGAIDIVTKPTPLPTDRLYDVSSDLIFKVKASAAARVDKIAPNLNQNTKVNTGIAISVPVRLVVIGTSTGGPQAITTLFTSLQADLHATFAVALHIPEGYTEPMAKRISQMSKVKLEEAKDGMELLPGQGVIAPGGKHLKIKAKGEKLFAVVTDTPLDTPHHPSVDVLFKSAAEQVGAATLGIILTGMGSDGTEGAQELSQKGAVILTESERSCVVYGMPRSVTEAGIPNNDFSIEKMGEVISSIVSTN